MDENEFEQLCNLVGGRYRSGLDNSGTCRSETDDSLRVDYDNGEAHFADPDAATDIYGDADDIEVHDGSLVMNDGEGWLKDTYYEDTTVSFNGRSGVDVVNGIGGRPPRNLL